eukprot:TRINITY_DN28823_c0_g1_i1.p1 TRINITY_DN28823_c0_g1~~TRINITY_DN28823_c0_g1_i1.p1  ORF type:complete len:372 (-),score=54.88 TRINITY_DN28823_c0_g1_i1:79-1194(-)
MATDLTCWGCGRSTADAEERLTALGHSWHPPCFTCTSCRTPLEQDFTLIGQRPYHSSCASRLLATTGVKCTKCSMVVVGKCVSAMGKKWHPRCLACVVCHLPISGGDDLAVDEGLVFHKPCLQKSEGFPRCPKCKEECEGAFMEAMEMAWHPQCFLCAFCSNPLEGSYATKDGLAYHQQCHDNKLAAEEVCDACGKQLGPDALQAIGHSYHSACFQCNFCKAPIDSQYTTDVETKVYHAGCLVEKRRIDRLNREHVLRERVRIWTDVRQGRAPAPAAFPPSFSYRPAIPADITNSLITEAQLRAEFQRYDVDGTGLLDQSEFTEAYKAFEDFGLAVTDADVKALLSRIRTHQEGAINFDEFCILMLRLAQR